jgi:beta-galactosidase
MKSYTLAAFFCAIILSRFSAPAQNISAAYAPDGSIYVGTDYYPEHWPAERWETDARLMKEAGFNIVRLAEFSWVKIEPEQGKYDFAWLDKAIELLARYNIKVVLGTPTAVMPAWLAHRYPDALAMNQDGSRIDWGMRKNNCFTNEPYIAIGNRLIDTLAAHYGKNPNVVGWQTDNEFSGPVCYCGSCMQGFQDWLKARYGSLDTLNQKWGTHFWGHTYHDWDEINFPDCFDFSSDWAPSGNPSLCLDWKRYHTWLQVKFQAGQVKIIRKHDPDAFVTHNLMGLHDNIDYYELAKDLDFVSWDNYPVWGKPDIPAGSSLAADVMRGVKGKNFWIMEQTAGPTGWGTFGRNLRPGELKKICYQQLAHGADAQVWFRWRSCTAGREQYWHGLLGHDGRPLRRYQEAAALAGEYHQLEKYLIGTTVKTPIAIIYDYENIWSVQGQRGFAGNSVLQAILRYYNALFRAGYNVDIIHRDADFSKYKLVIAPDQTIVPDKMAHRIVDFIRNGGVFLGDCRLAVKDENNLMHERTLPGLLSGALGIEIEEYEAMNDFTYSFTSQPPVEGKFTGTLYADWMKPTGAASPATYADWHMKDYAPFTLHTFGKGKGIYVGTIVKESSFYEKLVNYAIKEAGIAAALTPPPGVEISYREGQGRKLMFIINHTETSQRISLPKASRNLLTGKMVKEIELGYFGVEVLEDGVH